MEKMLVICFYFRNSRNIEGEFMNPTDIIIDTQGPYILWIVVTT